MLHADRADSERGDPAERPGLRCRLRLCAAADLQLSRGSGETTCRASGLFSQADEANGERPFAQASSPAAASYMLLSTYRHCVVVWELAVGDRRSRRALARRVLLATQRAVRARHSLARARRALAVTPSPPDGAWGQNSVDLAVAVGKLVEVVKSWLAKHAGPA